MPFKKALGTLVGFVLSVWNLRNRELLGHDFDTYGRELGLRTVWRAPRLGIELVVFPVSLTRYFEFPFVDGALPDHVGSCLDLSSPRLFSIRLAESLPDANITMINPDRADLALSEQLSHAVGLKNIDFSLNEVNAVTSMYERFDCAWSISVIEHISGSAGDSDAVRKLYSTVKPGGRMVITIPVDRTHWDEYRNADPYGTQEVVGEGRYFFQRYYDRQSIEDRLIKAVGVNPSRMQWWGESEIGRFEAYEREWMDRGLWRAVRTRLDVSRYFRNYDSWDDMPGRGVCGLVFEKPLDGD